MENLTITINIDDYLSESEKKNMPLRHSKRLLNMECLKDNNLYSLIQRYKE